MFKVEKTTNEVNAMFPVVGVQGYYCCNGGSMMICSAEGALAKE